jgi:hypothetical protein
MHSHSNTKEQHDQPRSATNVVGIVRNKQLSFEIENQPRILEHREYPFRAQWDGYSYTFGSMECSPEELGVICC